MKLLNALAAICIILYVADHFAKEIYIAFKANQLEREMKTQGLVDELRAMGLSN